MLAEAFLISDTGTEPVRTDDALPEADTPPHVQALDTEGLGPTHRPLVEVVAVRVVLGVVLVGVLGRLRTALGLFITDEFQQSTRLIGRPPVLVLGPFVVAVRLGLEELPQGGVVVEGKQGLNVTVLQAPRSASMAGPTTDVERIGQKANVDPGVPEAFGRTALLLPPGADVGVVVGYNAQAPPCTPGLWLSR
ncbi:hypothetical protein [Streptomyces sp. NPDC001536]|uniref:hypothetical protein n=1 Tax=Streptomyces sp. NPDC001536 TaxID=3364583 RepID=UPI00367E2668